MEENKQFELALEYTAPCDYQRVIMLKNKLIQETFDIINSFEWNSEKTNMDCWNGLSTIFKELNEAVKSAENDNKIKEKLKLKHLTEQRNKLNRQISTLKKATLN